jgi:hypothetical protein
VNVKAFFVAALSTALDLGIAAPDDVLRHVTPDVLANHLPRPLWARLLTACVGAPRVDAQLVVETIGVPNLCEHVPAPIIWACIAELASRALGGAVLAPVASAPGSRPNASAATTSRPIPLATPPPPPAETRATPPTPIAVGPSIPAPGAASEGDGDPRSRVPPSQRFRQSGTNSGVGRLAQNSARRPQAPAQPPPEPVDRRSPIPGGGDPDGFAGGAGGLPRATDRSTPLPRVKRGQTESDYDLETFVGGKDDWKNALAVEDEQLVDWSAADETVTNGEEFGRKR